ncbi:hypothetical protein K6959_10160 [Bacillus aquiflavi]|nr:hypothetical protein [Bacillus aquiflavi]UAC47116.1 hypothetical protein K6959_10160 [Bacillus aquiflavi]
MKKSKWDDEQLEELLRQMPKVTDYRDPRDIYQNISSKIKKRKKQNWMMPAFAGAVSLLLFLILTPGFLDLNRSANQEAKDEANNDLISKTSDNHSISTEKMEVIQDMELSNENENMKPTSTEQAITAVYEEDLKKYDKIIYAIPDENIQNIVPVTILVDKDEAKNWFEQFMEMSSSLSEQEWGLSNYYPLNAVIAYEDSTVQVDLPANHNYGQGSAAAETFF